MALEEFTGDLRNGPVELPCHTQRPAMQRDNLEEKMNARTSSDIIINL